MSEVFYKVVAEDIDGCLVSAAVTECAQVVYTPGVTAFPAIPNSALFAFDSYQQALDFAIVWGDFVYTCKGTRSKANPMHFPGIMEPLETYRIFWDMCMGEVGDYAGMENRFYHPVIPGTVFLDDCTLLERV